VARSGFPGTARAQTVRDVTVPLTTARVATVDPELLTSQGRRSLVFSIVFRRHVSNVRNDALLPNCPLLTCNLGCINKIIRNLKCHTHLDHSDKQGISAKLQEEFCLEGYDAVWVPVWNDLLPSFSYAPKTEALRSPKRYISTRLHGVTSHKTVLFIVTTVIPRHLTSGKLSVCMTFLVPFTCLRQGQRTLCLCAP